jgi:hypothetical protein
MHDAHAIDASRLCLGGERRGEEGETACDEHPAVHYSITSRLAENLDARFEVGLGARGQDADPSDLPGLCLRGEWRGEE